MAEYIEREAVKSLININFSGLLDAVDAIPAADVAPVVHGRWELVTTKYMAAQYAKTGYCQNCHEERLVDNYCPNCGAKMDGERKDGEG